MKVLSCILMLLSLLHPVDAQTTRIISGVVKDVNSFEPIPWVNVAGSNTGISTNPEGQFTMAIQDDDTLYFSHINYASHSVIASGITSDSLTIYLFPNYILLDNLIISDFLSEEVFKQKILGMHLQQTEEKINVDINMQKIKLSVLWGDVPAYDQQDIFKDFIQGPQGVRIFSSSSSQGLFRAIRNLLPVKSNHHFNSRNDRYIPSDTLFYPFYQPSKFDRLK